MISAEKRWPILFGFALCIVALSYLPILPATLVADDYFLHSPAFVSNPLKFFVQPVFPDFPEATYLRPLPMLTFAFDNLFRGWGPVAPHAINLLCHLMTTAVIGLIIFMPETTKPVHSGRAFGAVAGMLLFGLHRHATGTVCWVSARFELMAGLFGALGLLFWMRSARDDETNSRPVWYALLAFGGALLSKETALVFPVGALLWGLTRCVAERESGKWRHDLRHLLMLVALLIAYSVYRYAVLGQVGTGNPALALRGTAAAGYVLTLVWPFAGASGMISWPGLYAVVVLAVAGLIIWSALHQNGRPASPTAWGLPLSVLFLSLAALSIVPGTMRLAILGAETGISYVALMGLCVPIGWLVGRTVHSRRRMAGAVILAVMVAAFAWPQQYRIARWKEAGQRADSILTQTVNLVPDPAENSTLVFKGVPLFTKSVCYVFGIGLEEALADRYGRADLTVLSENLPVVDSQVFDTPPADAYVLMYDYQRNTLTLVQDPSRLSNGAEPI